MTVATAAGAVVALAVVAGGAGEATGVNPMLASVEMGDVLGGTP